MESPTRVNQFNINSIYNTHVKEVKVKPISVVAIVVFVVALILNVQANLNGSLGHGPGEFTTLMDFNIDREKETLPLLSNNDRSLFEYDLNQKMVK